MSGASAYICLVATFCIIGYSREVIIISKEFKMYGLE